MAKAAGKDEEVQDAQRHINQLTAKYANFSKASGLPTRAERLSVKGFKNIKISEKPFTNGKKGDIIMYRQRGAHRKTTSAGTYIVDKPTYNKIVKPAIKRGADIRIAEGEYLLHLEKNNASASTVGNIIFLKKDATISDVLEEVYHFEQNRKGINAEYSAEVRKVLNEIDAQEYLLSVSDKYKIPLAEIEITKRNLAYYKKRLRALEKEGLIHA